MTFPDHLRYSALHEWARLDPDGLVTVGISDYAQAELGEIQYIGLPRVGAVLRKDRPLGEAESVKTVSDIYTPCNGTVREVNAALAQDPSAVNRDPYGAWLVRIAPDDPAELDTLLHASAYEQLVAETAH